MVRHRFDVDKDPDPHSGPTPSLNMLEHFNSQQCCGSGMRCLFNPGPGSGIRNRFFPDLGSRIPTPYFLELSEKFFGNKFYNSLKTGPNFVLQHLKNKIIFNFVKFVVAKKV